jgi:hypothetical protein
MRDLCTPARGSRPTGRCLRRGCEETRALFNGRLGSSGFEKLLFPEDHGVDVVRGELEPVAMGNRVCGAGFDAVAAKDATGVVDIVDAGEALGARDALGLGIFLGFDIDAVGGASGGAEEASDALLEPVFVALQNMNAAVAGLEMHGLVGVVLGGRLSPKIAKGDAEALSQRSDRAANFFQERSHSLP